MKKGLVCFVALLIVLVLLDLVLSKPGKAYLPVISDYTVAYSFYNCSDDFSSPVCIELTCSVWNYPDWSGYCADYCECPPNRACYTVHRCYNECTIDLPKLPSQGGDWSRCSGAPTSIPALTPTNTPIPTPTPITPLCPLGVYQQDGTNRCNLDNTWTHYVEFTASNTGYIDVIEIKAGNTDETPRHLTCKITNDSGLIDLSATVNSADFFASQGDGWRQIVFWKLGDPDNNKVRVEKSLTYRIYCRGTGLYWLCK